MNIVLQQAYHDLEPSIVSINSEKINNLNFSNENKQILISHEREIFQNKNIKDIVRFLISLNSINYRFWDIQDNQFIRYQYDNHVGALALNQGFIGLYDELFQSDFDLSLLTIDMLRFYFGNMPDIEQRVVILKEVFQSSLFEQVFELIEEYRQTSSLNTDLAYKISQLLPLSYHDPYLKKIQLALYEIAISYQLRDYSINCDVTVAADYQIPKVLEGLGVLTYSEELSYKIAHYIPLPSQGEEERALRSATILACEQISQEHEISIPALDRYLWLGRNHFSNKNFHLTYTTHY